MNKIIMIITFSILSSCALFTKNPSTIAYKEVMPDIPNHMLVAPKPLAILPQNMTHEEMISQWDKDAKQYRELYWRYMSFVNWYKSNKLILENKK